MPLNLKRCKRSYLPRLFFQASLLTGALVPASVLFLSLTSVVHAQGVVSNERHQFNIPAGSLNSTLAQYIEKSGLLLAGTPEIGKDAKSAGLQGSYTTKEGLEVLLSGTGISYQITDDNFVKLLVVTDKGEATVLQPLLVTGTAPQRYKATSASSATAGAEIDLLDTPRSIQVVPEQVIVDQGARDLKDILRNVSGIQTQISRGGTTDGFILRGVEVDTISQDGVRRTNRDAPIQAANIERVEVVKGPTALLSGESSAGGVINVITKRPKEESRTIITANADEFGKREVLFDSTGKLTKDGTFLYRLVASTEDSETFREAASEAEIKRDLFAPSLTWNISENDKLTASLEYTSSELPFDNGTVVVQSADGSLDTADVDESLRFGEDSDIAEATQTTLNLEYEHFFENDWKLDIDFNYSSGDRKSLNNTQNLGFTRNNSALPLITDLLLSGAPVNLNAVEEGAILGRTAFASDSDLERISFALRLNGDVDFGTTEHNLTLGTDFVRREIDTDFAQAFISADAALGAPTAGFLGLTPGTFLTNFTELDIFNPEFGQVSELSDLRSNDITGTQIGVFFNDSIRFNEQWSALVGLRLDYFERDGTARTILGNTDTGNAALDVVAFQEVNTEEDTDVDGDTELSPSLGLVYKPLNNISLYTSYSESFEPQFFTNPITGEVIDVDPILSEQIEVGIKGAFLKNKVILGLSYFDLTRENIVGSVNGLGIVAFNDEELRRGVEFDSSVQFASGLSLNFNASHIIEAEIEGGTNAGNTPANIADTTANLWATYEFTGGSLRGLGLGGGANFVGERFIDDANSFELDSHTTYDATVFYYIPVSNGAQVRLQAGVRNLTDKETFIAQQNALNIGVGAPRTFFASLSYEF